MNTTAQAVQNQWYILRGENKYGPFEYSAMIRMMQNNELYDYNFVWAPHLDSWTLVGELADFSKDRLARLIENADGMRGSFKDRACPRVDVQLPVYGHNGQIFFDGQSLSLSENGALLLLNSPLMLPGQELLIHFRSVTDALPAFNLRAEIVRKNFTRTRLNVKSGLHYAVRFTQVSEPGQHSIKKIVNQKLKETGQ
ncbi:MAG: PilZ domain-containing protein [Bdellovibrionaceae bacterium]|nr:PilZ domain-containing protein [Pseudobdellovibrionaceae bacterium]